ncbi:MAG: DNA-binding response regulator, partial [Chloroflexales bacterium]|nr:DNA-binding response regulator [Chloroflexales bacterium]
MSKLRVLLADDHAVLREGLAALINAQDDMQVIAHASDGASAIDQALALRPDV